MLEDTLEHRVDNNAISDILNAPVAPLVDETDVEDIEDLTDEDVIDVEVPELEEVQEVDKYQYTKKHKEETKKLTASLETNVSYFLNEIKQNMKNNWESALSDREMKIFSQIYSSETSFFKIEEIIDSYILGPELKKTSVVAVDNLKRLLRTNARLASSIRKRINGDMKENDPFKFIMDRVEQVSEYLKSTYNGSSESGREVVAQKREWYISEPKRLVAEDSRIKRALNKWNSFKIGKESEIAYFKRMADAIISTIHFDDYSKVVAYVEERSRVDSKIGFTPEFIEQIINSENGTGIKLNADMLVRLPEEDDVSYYRKTVLVLAQTRFFPKADETQIKTREDYEMIIQSVMVSGVLIPELRNIHDYLTRKYNPVVADNTAYLMLRDWVVDSIRLNDKAKRRVARMLGDSTTIEYTGRMGKTIDKNAPYLREMLPSLVGQVIGIYSSVSSSGKERLLDTIDELRKRMQELDYKLNS